MSPFVEFTIIVYAAVHIVYTIYAFSRDFESVKRAEEQHAIWKRETMKRIPELQKENIDLLMETLKLKQTIEALNQELNEIEDEEVTVNFQVKPHEPISATEFHESLDKIKAKAKQHLKKDDGGEVK